MFNNEHSLHLLKRHPCFRLLKNNWRTVTNQLHHDVTCVACCIAQWYCLFIDLVELYWIATISKHFSMVCVTFRSFFTLECTWRWWQQLESQLCTRCGFILSDPYLDTHLSPRFFSFYVAFFITVAKVLVLNIQYTSYKATFFQRTVVSPSVLATCVRYGDYSAYLATSF
jgi:hypothetical protein